MNIHHLCTRAQSINLNAARLVFTGAVLVLHALCAPLLAAALDPPEEATMHAQHKPAQSFGPFGTLPVETNNAHAHHAYREMQERIVAESEIYAACKSDTSKCPAQLRSWKSLLASLVTRSRWERIFKLNAAINKMVSYRSDLSAYGQMDYWATPAESLVSGGDCEDIALVKYFSLRKLGFSLDELRLVIIKDTKRNLAHAVTTVDLAGKTYVLDNLTDMPVRVEYFGHYKPVYSISGQRRWIHLTVRKRVRKKHFTLKLR